MKVPACIPQFWLSMWQGSHSWTGSSCNVSLPCDRPVQIELIALEFPLACHIGRLARSHLASHCFLSECRPSQRHKWGGGGRSQTVAHRQNFYLNPALPLVTILKHWWSSDSSLQDQTSQRICNFPLHTSAVTN